MSRVAGPQAPIPLLRRWISEGLAGRWHPLLAPSCKNAVGLQGRWKQAAPASSPQATCAPVPSNAAPPPWVRAAWPSRECMTFSGRMPENPDRPQERSDPRQSPVFFHGAEYSIAACTRDRKGVTWRKSAALMESHIQQSLAEMQHHRLADAAAGAARRSESALLPEPC